MTDHARPVFLDSDIFVFDLLYLRDHRFHANRRLLNAESEGSDIDFHTAIQAGLAGLKVPQVLALTAQDGRILVTQKLWV